MLSKVRVRFWQPTKEIILFLEFWPYGLDQSADPALPESSPFSRAKTGFRLWRLSAGKPQSEKADCLIKRLRGKSYCNIIAARKLFVSENFPVN